MGNTKTLRRGSRITIYGQPGTVLALGPYPGDVLVRLDGETRADIWNRSQVEVVA